MIGSDGLRKPTKKRKTTRKPTSQVTAPPQPYMTPIYIPPQPVQIVRQRIQNQAAIQEQLRAYDLQQQAVINANDVRFNANNIGRKTVLYPEPPLAEPVIATKLGGEVDPREAQAQEQEAEERKAEEAEFQRKKKLAEQPVDPATMGFGEPARKRGRPAAGGKGGKKLKADLIKELKASGSGSLPEGFEGYILISLQRLAEERGISLVYE